MIKIGITGGIGSGKSVVSHLLKLMQIPVYISDDEAKRLTGNDPIIRRELVSLLGEKVYENGVLNKPLLAGFLFAGPENARIINGIIHPRVKEDFRQWSHKHSHLPVIATESAILIEAGFRDVVDKVILVYTPLELRISRTMARDCSTRDEVLKRINSQMSDEKKKVYADYIVINDGQTPVIPQILRILNEL